MSVSVKIFFDTFLIILLTFFFVFDLILFYFFEVVILVKQFALFAIHSYNIHK